jgi:hypothetical protein
MLRNILFVLSVTSGCVLSWLLIGDMAVRMAFAILWTLAMVSFRFNKKVGSK